MSRAAAQKEVTSAPLSKEQLIGYFESGCKPKSQWRCVCALSIIGLRVHVVFIDGTSGVQSGCG